MVEKERTSVSMKLKERKNQSFGQLFAFSLPTLSRTARKWMHALHTLRAVNAVTCLRFSLVGNFVLLHEFLLCLRLLGSIMQKYIVKANINQKIENRNNK